MSGIPNARRSSVHQVFSLVAGLGVLAAVSGRVVGSHAENRVTVKAAQPSAAAAATGGAGATGGAAATRTAASRAAAIGGAAATAPFPRWCSQGRSAFRDSCGSQCDAMAGVGTKWGSIC